MKDILKHLFENKTLSKSEAKQVLTDIALQKHNNSHIVAFMTAYCMRSITIDELEGFRDAMLELCIPVDFSAYNAIDMCGTGGDGKDTFNISTLASFVVAGAGFKVAKHGNYGVSSNCGSSNVMEFLGYKFTTDYDKLKRELDEVGVCILHAPLFHPAMKNVAPFRKEMGVKTFFNILGPMVNPSQPQNQMVGVFSMELARVYTYIYQKTTKNFAIVHSFDGYDEVSLTGPFKVLSTMGEHVYQVKDLGLPVLNPISIQGGEDIKASAKIFTDILQGNGTKAQQNVVIANAAVAIRCINPSFTLEMAAQAAAESLKSKKALQSFEKLIAINV